MVTLLALCVVALFCNFFVGVDKMPMPLAVATYKVGTSYIFILLYLFMLFLLIDILRLARIVPTFFTHGSVWGSLTVLVVMVGVFAYGNAHYQHKVRQPIYLETGKPLMKPLKIVMLSDLHLGYNNRRTDFSKWVDMVNAEHADLILIGGDIMDGSSRPLVAENVVTEFHRINAPIYACFGNHEYIGGSVRALGFYKEAGIHLLRDSVATIDGINIVGRDDRSNHERATLKTLMAHVDKSKYTILLDHQPYHLEEAEANDVDFQLSGHTHYGQVAPISWIEDRLYEDAYGPLTKGDTRYFVTSGIGIWGGKFRIGTRSEYLVAELYNKR